MTEQLTIEQSNLEAKVGPELYAKAAAEIDIFIPPRAKDGNVHMPTEAVRTLMIAAWLRGWGARREAMS